MSFFKRQFSTFRSLKQTRVITLCGVLAALYAVSYSPIGRIVILPDQLELRFGFLILGIAAMLLGPFPAATIALVGDLIGTLIFYGGGFFFGYTLNWMIQGFVFGLFLYENKLSLLRVICALSVNMLLVNFTLTPFWLTIQTGVTFQAALLQRIPKNLITFPFYVAGLYFVLKGAKSIHQRIPGGTRRKW